MKKKKSKPRNGAALVGAWRFYGKGPEVKFRMRNSATDLKMRLEFPRSTLDMTEKAWRSFFRFMLATMKHVRPETVSEEAKRWVKWKREERMKRWKKRRRIRRLQPKTVPNHKPDPIPEPVQVGPSAELLETAIAKLEQEA